MQVGATYQTQLDPPPAALRMKREKLQSTGTLAWLRFGRTVSDIEDYYGACVDEVTDESDTTNNCSSCRVGHCVAAAPAAAAPAADQPGPGGAVALGE